MRTLNCRMNRNPATLVMTFAIVCAVGFLTPCVTGQTNANQFQFGGGSRGSGGGGSTGSFWSYDAGGGSGGGGGTAGTTGVRPGGIVFDGFEPIGGAHSGSPEATWLGVEIEEAPEALTAQLRLDPGVGLVVTYVASNSPAAQAGLQKDDVLVEFAGQALVHPMQLRKLIHVRKPGDSVKLVFYRGGKKETASATLAKNVTAFDFPFENSDGGIFRISGGSPDSDAFREQMKALREQLANVRINQKQVQAEISRSMADARKAYQDALRQASNEDPAITAALNAELKNLTTAESSMNNNATITVRSTGRSAKSLVMADDSGTIVLVRNPKLYLTAHDLNGKLLFDGEIETTEQRSHVPPALWKKVEPLVKKLSPDPKTEPAKESLFRRNGVSSS